MILHWKITLRFLDILQKDWEILVHEQHSAVSSIFVHPERFLVSSHCTSVTEHLGLHNTLRLIYIKTFNLHLFFGSVFFCLGWPTQYILLIIFNYTICWQQNFSICLKCIKPANLMHKTWSQYFSDLSLTRRCHFTSMYVRVAWWLICIHVDSVITIWICHPSIFNANLSSRKLLAKLSQLWYFIPGVTRCQKCVSV